MAKAKAKRNDDDAAAPRPAGLKRKRGTEDEAALRSSKRSAARASLTKLKEIADDEKAFEEEEQERVVVEAEAKELAAKEIDMSKMEVVKFDNGEMIVAPGFRLWETSSTLMARGGETLKMTKGSKKSETRFERILSVQYPELFKLVPLVITQGPYQGRHVFMLEPETGGFRFMDLPAELRTLVYSFIVDDGVPINMSTIKKNNHPRRPVRTDVHHVVKRRGGRREKDVDEDREQQGVVSLLSISKKIQSEAAPILYGNNRFRFYDFVDMRCFLDAIGSMRQHLRFVHTSETIYRRSAYSHLTSLGDAIGLCTFTVDHKLACSESTGPYWRWSHSPAGLASTVIPFLRVLKATKRPVLDIVKVTWKRCEPCEKAAPEFPSDSECRQKSNPGWTSCNILCKDLAKHCEKMEREIRKHVAKTLGIGRYRRKKGFDSEDDEDNEKRTATAEDITEVD